MIRMLQTIKPGKRGTRKLLEKYGNRLVCVRYRYDFGRRKRVTTVELVEEESAWKPKRILASTKVQIRIEWKEKDLRQLVWEHGGKWVPERKVWVLTYGKVRELQLEDKLV